MNSFTTHITELCGVLNTFTTQEHAVSRCLQLITKAITSSNKILTCGNGGSASDALHLAEELVGRYEKDRRALPGLCLCADSTAITCIANDFGFDQVFSRQVKGLGKPDDVLVCFSTSGNSKNIVEALKTARALRVKTILLSGLTGGISATLADNVILVPSSNTARIQEVHTLVIHSWLQALETLV